MNKKLTTTILTGAGVAGIATASATVYSNNKTIKSNERIHSEKIQSEERIEMAKIQSQERIEMEKIELEKVKTGLSSKYDSDSKTKVDTDLESERTDLIKDCGRGAPADQERGYAPRQDYLKIDTTSTTEQNKSNDDLQLLEDDNLSLPSPSDSFFAGSPFESYLPDMSTHSIIQGAGFSFACFAFIGLFAGISLGFNFVIKYYGDQKIENLPK